METLLSTKTQSWLIWFLRGVVILGFLVLVGRLIDLQIIRGKYFRVLAEENRIRRVPIVAARGKIYARGGEVIAENKEVEKLILFNPESGFEKKEISGAAAPESTITEWVRKYPEGSDFAHITGYLGEVSGEELGRVEAECLDKGPKRLGAFIGRGGLEEKYDCILRGIDGEELVEVDARGAKVRVLGRKNSIPGDDIHTTIDFGLQQKLAEIMRDKVGAGIVTDAAGEVLAFYSTPSYDPNYFVDENKKQNVEGILKDKNLPLFNRVTGGKYHPGSVFKPVVAVAALEEGKIDENFTFEDNGFIAIQSIYGDFTYNNWYYTQYGGREGVINLEKAIARSTDTFFYKVGELTGVENISKWSHTFGLDMPTGIDIPGEAKGLVPDPVWKVRTKGERWFLGNTYHLSIGQGDIALTPLGLNMAIASIANNGEYCQPHVIAFEESKSFASVAGYSFPISNFHSEAGYLCRNLGIKQENIDLVKNGMVGACSSGGTGFTFFDFKDASGGIEVGCKTGTAETDDSTEDTHAWFTAFAPREKPEIVATILVERGGEGSRVAGPIMRELFNHYFDVREAPSASPSATPANDRN